MDHDRRTFLKTTSIAAAMAAASLPAATQAVAQSGPKASEPKVLPKGMTFATLRRPDGLGLGLRTDRGILDVVAAEQDFREGAPTTIDAVLTGQGDIDALKRLADKARASASADRYFVALDKAAFGPCVTNPEKIVCIGLNYRKHCGRDRQPACRSSRSCSTSTTPRSNYHGGTISVSEEDAQKFDYEAELVIVIGRRARNVCGSGRTQLHFRLRHRQRLHGARPAARSTQWMLGKSLDGSAPVGPWLVTADQVDGDNLKIECRVNGEVRQSSNTSDMVFNCKQLVSYISKYFTLKPGDIIFTGTPEGVISGYPKDKQVWLKAGDKVVTSIEKLGDLSFTLT